MKTILGLFNSLANANLAQTALIGSGIEPSRISIAATTDGGTLLTVDATDNDADRIAAILTQHDAIDIDKRAAQNRVSEGQTTSPKNPPETSTEKTAEQASRLPNQEKEALDALQKGDIGGPEATPGPRGIDRVDLPSSGGTIGSIGTGMGEGISDIAGTRRTTRIQNP